LQGHQQVEAKWPDPPPMVLLHKPGRCMPCPHGWAGFASGGEQEFEREGTSNPWPP
jgi:hypothetical protein